MAVGRTYAGGQVLDGDVVIADETYNPQTNPARASARDQAAAELVAEVWRGASPERLRVAKEELVRRFGADFARLIDDVVGRLEADQLDQHEPSHERQAGLEPRAIIPTVTVSVIQGVSLRKHPEPGGRVEAIGSLLATSLRMYNEQPPGSSLHLERRRRPRSAARRRSWEPWDWLKKRRDQQGRGGKR